MPESGPNESAAVGELDGEVEVGALDEGDDGLEVVALLARDAELVALDLHLDALGAVVTDELGHLLGLLGADALAERAVELHLFARLPGVAGLQRLERDATLDEFLLEDVEDGERTLVGVGRDLDAVLAVPLDLRAGVLEVVAVRDLLGRLVEGVVGLLAVELADNVERRVGHDYSWGSRGDDLVSPSLGV